MTDALSPDRLLPLLHGRFGSPCVYVEECPSTQQLLADGGPEGAIAVAEMQTAGRGRLGRPWEAPRGASILCSVLLRPPAGRSLPTISLVAGLATARAVERSTGLAALVKWPNDVVLDGRKVAGVLAEGKGRIVVLGIGLNVNQTERDLPARQAFPAGSLRIASGHEHDRVAVLAELLDELERCYDRWVAAGIAPFAAELRERDALLGRAVLVGELRGEAAGLDAEGRLLIRTDGRLVPVESGEIALA